LLQQPSVQQFCIALKAPLFVFYNGLDRLAILSVESTSTGGREKEYVWTRVLSKVTLTQSSLKMQVTTDEQEGMQCWAASNTLSSSPWFLVPEDAYSYLSIHHRASFDNAMQAWEQERVLQDP
jgi:hypothetical protein